MIPRALIFDLGKVIVDFDHMTFCRNLSRLCPHTPEEIYAAIFGSGLEQGFDSGALSAEAFYCAAREALDIRIGIRDFARLWSAIFTINESVATMLRQLKPQYRLLCLSNTNPWHFAWCLERYPALQLFERFILSYEERCCKPDTRIYLSVLRQAGEPAGSCLYIDDRLENVQAAQNLGMQAVQFTGAAALRAYLRDSGIPGL